MGATSASPSEDRTTPGLGSATGEGCEARGSKLDLGAREQARPSASVRNVGFTNEVVAKSTDLVRKDCVRLSAKGNCLNVFHSQYIPSPSISVNQSERTMSERMSRHCDQV